MFYSDRLLSGQVAALMSAFTHFSRASSIESIAMLLKDKTNKLINSDPKHLRRVQTERSSFAKVRSKSSKSSPLPQSKPPDNKPRSKSPSSPPPQMDVSHLAMGEMKTASSFSVKDLLDLQESGLCGHPLSAALGGSHERSGHLSGPHPHLLHGLGSAQQAVSPELGEIVTNNHDNRDSCHGNQPQGNNHGESPSVTATFYDQDNPYTRWLQSNETIQYSGKIHALLVVIYMFSVCP